MPCAPQGKTAFCHLYLLNIGYAGYLTCDPCRVSTHGLRTAALDIRVPSPSVSITCGFSKTHKGSFTAPVTMNHCLNGTPGSGYLTTSEKCTRPRKNSKQVLHPETQRHQVALPPQILFSNSTEMKGQLREDTRAPQPYRH